LQETDRLPPQAPCWPPSVDVRRSYTNFTYQAESWTKPRRVVAKVESIKAISEGYDLTVGITHEGSNGSSKCIFDLMEPERPKVDRALLDFVHGNIFGRADSVIRTDGVCRLITKTR
jgi:hypothetical protein